MLAMYRLAAFLITTSVMAAACGGNAPADAGNAAATSPAAAPPSAPADVNTLGKDDRTAGTGAEARPGMMVSVHYTGWLYDPSATDTRGTKFDSSKDRGQPFEFQLGKGDVIAGWDEGVAGMKVGGKRTLLIPAWLGYGSSGAGGVIPPNASLVFEVELLGVTAN